MSLAISTDDRLDPFAKRFQECPKCGGRLILRIEANLGGGQKTWQVCRKCNHQVLTSSVNLVKVK